MDSMPAYLHLPNVNKLNNNNNNSHFNHHPSTIMSVSNDSDASNNTTNVINTTNNNNNSNDDQIETVKFNTNSTFALHQSVLDGRIKQIDYFLKMGLKVNSKDKYGRTALMLTCLSDHEQYGLKVAKLLIKRGADLNVRDSLGRTVMFIACSEKREKLFNYLMDDHGYSIDFRVKDNDGNVLLNHVALYGSNKMLKKVIEKMKEKHVELDHRNNSGYSALLLAIQNDKFLNAYTLIKDGNSSPSIQDNEKYYNALEWLVNRIEINKNFILGTKSNIMENSDSMSSSTMGGLLVKSRKNTFKNSNESLNYKTWYNNNNQYFQTDNMCEHNESPNYSTDYQKSRFMPLILRPRINSSVIHNSSSQIITPRYLPILVADSHENSNRSSSKENLIDLEENIDLKELVQKLYETIYFKMSESYNKSKQAQITQTILENEKQLKQLGKNKARAPSMIKENKQLLAKTTGNNNNNTTKIDEDIKINKIDTNIFNLDSMRQTPKLVALLPVFKQSTKEAVHSMLDMYDWSRPDLFQSHKSIMTNQSPISFDKSRSKSIIHSNKERSNLSNKTNGSANATRVKFNIDA